MSINHFIIILDGLGDLQTKYIKKYGRLYKTWIGNQFVVQISHPDDLEVRYYVFYTFYLLI